MVASLPKHTSFFERRVVFTGGVLYASNGALDKILDSFLGRVGEGKAGRRHCNKKQAGAQKERLRQGQPLQVDCTALHTHTPPAVSANQRANRPQINARIIFPKDVRNFRNEAQIILPGSMPETGAQKERLREGNSGNRSETDGRQLMTL